MRSTPLQRALRRLADLGFAAERLRTRAGSRRRRRSPFAWLDLLGLAPGRRPLAVCLVADEAGARDLAGILARQPAARCWLKARNRLEVWCLTGTGPRCRRRWLVIRVKSAPAHVAEGQGG